MSKPAARIGDMHVCPMATPGTPPIPHVGGPIIGPGVPTVLIGGKPAAVMGDMCVCTGPPDTITLGSTGVLIGGKPAARMGDMCAHGGTIVIGQPNVLIGEISPDGMGKFGMVLNSVMAKIRGFEGGAAGALAVRQTLAMKKAAVEGAAFCEVCEAAAREEQQEEEDTSDAVTEPEKRIDRIYFTDMDGNEITEVDEEQGSVMLVIEGENIVGEEIFVTLYDHIDDFTYNGNEIENGQLAIVVNKDASSIQLDLKK